MSAPTVPAKYMDRHRSASIEWRMYDEIDGDELLISPHDFRSYPESFVGVNDSIYAHLQLQSMSH